jgi:hypothetical protein
VRGFTILGLLFTSLAFVAAWRGANSVDDIMYRSVDARGSDLFLFDSGCSRIVSADERAVQRHGGPNCAHHDGSDGRIGRPAPPTTRLAMTWFTRTRLLAWTRVATADSSRCPSVGRSILELRIRGQRRTFDALQPSARVSVHRSRRMRTAQHFQ